MVNLIFFFTLISPSVFPLLMYLHLPFAATDIHFSLFHLCPGLNTLMVQSFTLRFDGMFSFYSCNAPTFCHDWVWETVCGVYIFGHESMCVY